jgi:hypothetical protein
MKSLLSFKLMELPDLFYLWFYLLKYRHYIIDDGRWDSDEAGTKGLFSSQAPSYVYEGILKCEDCV